MKGRYCGEGAAALGDGAPEPFCYPLTMPPRSARSRSRWLGLSVATMSASGSVAPALAVRSASESGVSFGVSPFETFPFLACFLPSPVGR